MAHSCPGLCLHLHDFLTWTSQAQPQCVQIQKAWLGGVVPAVTDNESSVQDKALECLDRLLLQSIRHHSEGCKADDGQALAWALLALLDTDSRKLGYAFPGQALVISSWVDTGKSALQIA